MIACSMDLMPTASPLMFSVQAASHGAGQMRPVNSGKLLVNDNTLIAFSQSCLYASHLKSGNDVVDRTAVVTKRNAAVHTAREPCLPASSSFKYARILCGAELGSPAHRRLG